MGLSLGREFEDLGFPGSNAVYAPRHYLNALTSGTYDNTVVRVLVTSRLLKSEMPNLPDFPPSAGLEGFWVLLALFG